jgi:hypothetical protein
MQPEQAHSTLRDKYTVVLFLANKSIKKNKPEDINSL